MKTKGRRIALATGGAALIFLGLAGWIGWPHLRAWYRFRSLFESIGKNAQGFLEYRHRKTGAVMVRLPGGKFWMGAQNTDPQGPNYDPEAKDDEGPVHEVTLSPFLIGKYEVTQAQWKSVMGSYPSHFHGNDDLPVESISWDDIQHFASRKGLSLSSVAQCEYVCREPTLYPS